MKFRSVRHLQAKTSAVPRIPLEEVRPLWYGSYYDGPIDGVAVVNGERVWFESDWSDHDATYWLVRLRPEQLADEEAVHADIQRWVADTEYDPHTGLFGRDRVTFSDAHHFYVKYGPTGPPHPDLDDNDVLGWFEFV